MMKRFFAGILLLMTVLLCSACGTADNTKDSGYTFKDGTLTVSKIYYTVLNVTGKPKCVYEKPWVSYTNSGEVKRIVIDADMVYTKTNYQTGEPYPDAVSNNSEFLGGGVLFGGIDSLESLSIERLNLDRITDVSEMFSENQNLTEIDVSGLDLSGVQDASYLFSGNPSLTHIDLNALDTSSLVTVSDMLKGCTSLESVSAASWNTGNIKDFSRFCFNCPALKTVDLSGWIIKDADVSGMLADCDSLTNVSLSDVDLMGTISANAMFNENNSITSYMFTEDWQMKDAGQLGEFCYFPVIIGPIYVLPPPEKAEWYEEIYYSKEMPEWYRSSVKEHQAIADWTRIETSEYLDVYWTKDMEDFHSVYSGDGLSAEGIKTIVQGMTFTDKLSQEDADTLCDIIDNMALLFSGKSDEEIAEELGKMITDKIEEKLVEK